MSLIGSCFYFLVILPALIVKCFSQAAFSRARKICRPFSTGAVICGHRQMREVSLFEFT